MYSARKLTHATTHIRQASRDDIPRLCELLAILFEQEADFQPDTAKQTAALRGIIEHPEIGHILVLHSGDKVCGMVNLLYTLSTACGSRVALLEDMIVHPAWRGDGLGSELLQAAVTLARNRGCRRITLLTDRANDTAIRFYQRHGFTLSEMLPLRLMLDADLDRG